MEEVQPNRLHFFFVGSLQQVHVPISSRNRTSWYQYCSVACAHFLFHNCQKVFTVPIKVRANCLLVSFMSIDVSHPAGTFVTAGSCISLESVITVRPGKC